MQQQSACGCENWDGSGREVFKRKHLVSTKYFIRLQLPREHGGSGGRETTSKNGCYEEGETLEPFSSAVVTSYSVDGFVVRPSVCLFIHITCLSKLLLLLLLLLPNSSGWCLIQLSIFETDAKCQSFSLVWPLYSAAERVFCICHVVLCHCSSL